MGLERHACPAANLGALWRARRGLACALAIAVFGVGVPSPPRVAAHPPSLLGQSTREAIGAELEAFRARMASAVAKRDAKALQAMYADEFVHTDRAGRRSRLAERLAGIQAGETVLEGLAASEVKVRTLNGWAAAVTGASRYPQTAGGQGVVVHWTMFYVRLGDAWRLAASQETRVAD